MRKNILVRRLVCVFFISIILIVNLVSIINIASDISQCDKYKERFEEIPSNIKISSNNPPKKKYFSYYKEIIIDHSKVSGTTNLVNFPVLISIYDCDLHYKVQDDGDDIAFSNGTIWLDHEVELFNKNYNTTHAKLIAWIRFPSLSPSTDTNIIMYYGNSSMSSRQNAWGVWDSNYKGVWHLKEDPTISPPQFKDSSSYNNNGTAVSLSSSNQVDGKIDGSIVFDDSNERCINVSDHTSLQLAKDMTVSGWVKTDNTDQYVNCIITKWSLNLGNQNYWLGKINQNEFAFYVNSTEDVKVNLNLINDNNWHYVIGVADSTNNLLRIYIDGIEINNASYSGSSQTGIHFLNIGRSSGIIEQEWDGGIDEVRISNVSRSPEWILTEYNNQYNPNSFYTVSKAMEVNPLSINDFSYYKEITIDHNQISGLSDLINFPLLISLYDSDLHNHAQPDGDDIVFYNGSAFLAHEIEIFNQTYNSTHAQLVAWVRIPSLSTATNTNITMYYGNSSMSSRQDAWGVWGENYCFVLHMNQDPSSSNILDSTSNGFDFNVEVSGGMTSDDLVNGQTGKAIEFDGSNDFLYLPLSEGFDGPTDKMMFEFWIKFPNGGPSLRDVLMAPISSDDSNAIAPSLCFYKEFEFETNTTSSSYIQTNRDFTKAVGTWEHIVCLWDGVGDGLHQIYVNGTLENEDNTPLTGTHMTWNTISIGTLDDSSDGPGGAIFSDRSLNAILSEIRLSKIVRSADWIATEYNNQRNPHSFYNVSSEKIPDSSPPTYTNLIESSDPLELGDIEVITINVTDPSGINQVKIEFEGTNHSMTNISKTLWQYDSWTPSSVGNYSYTIWMEDNYHNWNSTIGTIEVIDTTPPTYSNLIESANPLQLGQNETISIKVYDSPGSGVNQVLLEYADTPSGTYFNHTMKLISGNTWSWSNWKPLLGGDYLYKVYMQDLEDNWNITTGTITVISTTAPFIENLTESADPLELGDNITITVDVYDIETNVSTVFIELEGVNNTMNYIGGYSYEYTLTRSFVGIVNYKIYANDTDNNWNSLSGSFDIVDTTSPNFIALTESADPLEFGSTEIISINCTDLTGIKQVKIEFGGLNHSMSNIGGDTWQYDSWTPSSVSNYSYKIWIEDNYNNWNYTIGSILVHDTSPPIYSNLVESADPVELGTPLIITIISTDLSNVDQVLIEFEGNNHSMDYFGGDLWRYDEWLPNTIGTYPYTIHMRDIYDNWNFTTDSIMFYDSIAPVYRDLIEDQNPLELGNPVNIRITVSDFAGINRTLIEFEGNNHSMVNIGGNLWEYDSWIPNDDIVYQYKIFMEDNSGNWNLTTGTITVQDTIPPSAPILNNPPSGDITGSIVFDWLDGSDPSGISYYILIIDNEENPLITPGYIYFLNITISYYELTDTLPTGKYYYFIAQIDGAGLQSDYTMGSFTINVYQNNDLMIYIVIIIAVISVLGSITGIIIIRKRSQKKLKAHRKKIPLKLVLSHIKEISSSFVASDEREIQELNIQKQNAQNTDREKLLDKMELEPNIKEIKILGEQLFEEGAYLEAIKQFEYAKEVSRKLGRQDDVKLFSELIDGINALIKEREIRIEALDKEKIEGNSIKIFELYQDIINISKKLREFDAVNMFKSEMVDFFSANNVKLVEIQKHRVDLEEQAELSVINGQYEKSIHKFEKCEQISELLMNFNKNEITNIDKFKNKKFESFQKLAEK